MVKNTGKLSPPIDIAQRRKRDALRQRRKRERDIQSSGHIGIPTTCTPEIYPSFPCPDGTVSQTIVKYMQNLQQNDCVARPCNWSEIIHLRSRRRDHEPPPLQHPWNYLRQIHYCVAPTHADLEQQLVVGLPLPVLISPLSNLGQEITTQTPWFHQPLDKLLNEVLKEDKATIYVQDHAKANVSVFTVPKECKDVRDRFRMDPQRRGCAWNCLEIDDRLPGHKGPKCLEHGAKLRDWQFANPADMSVSRARWSALPDAKRIDRWLLVSEEKSASTAHLDVALATWVSCLAGKKTFWLRNPTVIDRAVWEVFDIDHDHRMFEEPWARIDLYPGYTLVFPPGIIHAVFTEKDTVCCGGHFLTSQVMDRFVEVLGQTELDPSQTNDLKGVDFFRILENFIVETLESSPATLTRAQLYRFILRLKEYVNLKVMTPTKSTDAAESKHLNRRNTFIKKLQKQKWIQKLKNKLPSVNWVSSLVEEGEEII